MPFLRNVTAFSSFTRRTPMSLRQPLAARQLSSAPARFAQGYGDGKGDPKGENPLEQGEQSSATSELERTFLPFRL